MFSHAYNTPSVHAIFFFARLLSLSLLLEAERQEKPWNWRGDEWSFKNYESRKVLVGFHMYRSFVFFSGYVRLAVSIFFMKLSRSLDFLQGKGSFSQSPDLFVCFFKKLMSSGHLILNLITQLSNFRAMWLILNCPNSTKCTATSF